MKSADVVGKKIVRVSQHRVWNFNRSAFYVHVSCIELEDGTRIFPQVIEGDGDYQIIMTADKSKKKKRATKP